jgi:Domain of unknown function (DUF5610)
MVMNIAPLHASPLGSFVSPSLNTQNDLTDGVVKGLNKDLVALSGTAHRLLESFVDKSSAPAFAAIPADQRPSAQESADTILGFIGKHLATRTAQGANDEALDKALNQALKGFKQGLSEASKMIQGLGMMTEDIQSSIKETKSLVLEGLDRLRDIHLGSSEVDAQNPPPADSVVTQVTAFSELRSDVYVSAQESSSATGSAETGTVRASAAVYAESYRSRQSVDLAVQTRDGDIVTLSFSSDISSSRAIAAFLANTGQTSAATAAYQSNQSVSSSFNLSVRGDLDQGELEALNTLFEQVAKLADEFFNGDFDQAFLLANEFEMDTGEFSALSLDIARNTQASVVQAFSSIEGRSSAPAGDELAVSGLDMIEQMLENLRAALESAKSFAEPQSLLSELLANQVAQHSMLVPQNNAEAISQMMDSLLGTLV